MKCTRVEKFLPLYIADDLTGRRRTRAVENHLAACEGCRRAADEYRASREMFRASALAPDFDGAFYEELRNSVLARVASDRTPVPPGRFSRLFDVRLAYAASLALLFIVAALSLHSYTRHAPEEGATQKMIANANRERPTTPETVKTTPAIRPSGNDRPTPRPAVEPAPETTGRERRASKSLPPAPHRNIERAGNKSSPGSPLTGHAPLRDSVNLPAPATPSTTQANAGEMAVRDGGGTNARHEVSRIEIQTSDPNIRIIWLSPGAEDPAQPLK
ncbi:MAG TPA: zf-HC2 domain-containing protein [Pyrinomonadaceae bacterium]